MYKSVLVETRPLPTSICFWGLLDLTDFPLRLHSSSAAGFEGLEVQVKLRTSPAFKLFLGSLPDMTGVLSGSSEKKYYNEKCMRPHHNSPICDECQTQ